MSERELFEKCFPVPHGVFWDSEFSQYETNEMEYEPDADEYHRMWQVWQAARAQSGQGAEVVARESGRNKGLAVRRSKIERGVYKVVREDGEVFLISRGIRSKGWTIENQRNFRIESAIDLSHAEYQIRNCFGSALQEVRQK